MVVDKPMTRVLPELHEDTNEFHTHAFQNNMSFIASGNKVSTNINGKNSNTTNNVHDMGGSTTTQKYRLQRAKKKNTKQESYEKN